MRLWWIILAAIVISTTPAGAQRGLGLAPDQRERLQDLIRQTKQDTFATRQALFQKRQALVQAYANYDLNEKKAHETIRTINDIQRRLLDLNYQNQAGIRCILDKQQFEIFADELKQRPRRRHAPMKPPSIDAMDGLVPGDMARQGIERLKLSPDQVERVKAILHPNAPGRKSPDEGLRENTEAVRQLYSNYELDDKRVKKLLDKMNGSQRRLLESGLRRQIELRRVLSKEQFDMLMADVRRGMKHRFDRGPRFR